MKFFTLTVLSLLVTFAHAQTLLFNDGATIKVQTGAVLYVEGNIENTASGTIDNDGTIELKGNFVNAGMWEPSQPNTLKFSGDAHSDVTAGSAVFQNVQIQKGNTFNVNLLSNVTINNNLDFNGTNNKITLGTFNLNMGPVATATGQDMDEFVVTGSTGVMKKDFTSFTSFEFPVGFDAATYNPATLNVTGGPNDTYSVRVGASPTNGNGFSGTPIATDVVNAVWEIQETTPGGNTADLTLGWQDTDELPGFNPALNAVSRNDGVNGWDGLFAALGPEVGNTRTRNGLTSFGAFAVGDKTVANELVLNPKVFLQGNFSGGQMTDALRTLALIPTAEPYAPAPYNYVHVAYGGGETVPGTSTFDQPGTVDDVVDWVIVELRDPATPATRLATKAALLQRDGNIVDLDGSSNLKIPGLADGNYHIMIRHRNHLGIRTGTAQALSNTVTSLDFTTPGLVYDADGAGPHLPMVTLSGGALGMWTGDVTGDKIVRLIQLASPPFTPGDKPAILVALSGNPNGQLDAYHRADLNLDGKVRLIQLASPPFTPGDAPIILGSVLGGNPNGTRAENN